MLLSAGFGLVCWRNFNKGLAHFRKSAVLTRLKVWTNDGFPVYVESVLADVAFEPEVFVHDKRIGYPQQLPEKRISLPLKVNPSPPEIDLHPPLDEPVPPYSGYFGKAYAFDNKDSVL